MSLITEKQFLELSNRERNGWVAEKVFAHKEDRGVYYYDAERGEYVIPDYTTTWEGMGKGIEHAKANFYDVELHIPREGFYRKCVVYRVTGNVFAAWTTENIFVAFWIAYCKAMGVLE